MVGASGSSKDPGTVPNPQRLRGEDRRAVLVEAATRLAEQGLDAISMESVAAQAGVSRPLVYKHFANRDELLAAVFRQQAIELDSSIAAAVEGTAGFEDKVRALVRAVLDAVSRHGTIFIPLLRAGVRDPAFRREQRSRDRRTVRFFARLAADEFGLDEVQAKAATAVLLSGIDSILAQWRSRPTAAQARFLEDVYVDLVMGGLARVGAHQPTPSSS
jgi:AcrR family transcriptional regulator